MNGPPDRVDAGADRSGPWSRREERPAARMGFGTAIRTCLSKYVTFSGRATRAEYWWFILFTWLGGAAAGLLDAIFFDIPEDGRSGGGTVFILEDAPLALFGLTFNLAMLPPQISAGWRRMHDTGRSGLYLLYPFIVMVGIATFATIAVGFPEGGVQDASMIVLALAGFVLLISPLLVLWWLTRPSQPAANRYGPPPPR